jgi:hypothetical protein
MGRMAEKQPQEAADAYDAEQPALERPRYRKKTRPWQKRTDLLEREGPFSDGFSGLEK